jgi:hypothetical protein
MPRDTSNTGKVPLFQRRQPQNVDIILDIGDLDLGFFARATNST